MSIRKCTPCDCDGICPYDAIYSRDCEYWCGADEPEDDYSGEELEEDYLEWLERMERKEESMKELDHV